MNSPITSTGDILKSEVADEASRAPTLQKDSLELKTKV